MLLDRVLRLQRYLVVRTETTVSVTVSVTRDGAYEPAKEQSRALTPYDFPQAQRTHFWCHERNHSPHTLPVVVRWAQDAGLLLHPDLHRVHHERYDCNFPILTGWTNRYVQFLYEASVRCGLVDTGLGQKPTTIGPTKS